MKQDVKDFMIQKVKEMMDSFSCCAEAKEAGQRWLDDLGTEKEAEETKKKILCRLTISSLLRHQMPAHRCLEKRRQKKWLPTRRRLKLPAENIVIVRHVLLLRRFLTRKTR